MARRRRPSPPHTTHLLWPSCFDIDEKVRKDFVASIVKASTEGDVVLVSPRARSTGGRAQISRALREEGAPPHVVAILGWATAMPDIAKPEAPRVKPSAIMHEPEHEPKPEPIDDAIEDITQDD